MQKLAFYNAKGGVGKSTLATNIAHGLALADYKVLLIDLDPQNDCSLFLGIDEDWYSKTFYHLLNYQANLGDCLVQIRKNLDLLPNSNYRGIESILHEEESNIQTIFSDILNDLEEYDYVLFDCSPSNTLTNNAILYYVDGLIVPVQLKLASVKGISNIYSYLEELGLGSDLIKLIVPNMFDARLNESKDNLKELKDIFEEDNIVTKPIRRRVKISESANAGQTVFEYGTKAEEQFFPILREVVNLE